MSRIKIVITELINVLDEMIDNSKMEISSFHIMSPDRLFEQAQLKDELMKLFISKQNLLEKLASAHADEIESFIGEFATLEEKLTIFKQENKKLMLVTFALKEVYDELHDDLRRNNIKIVDTQI